MTNSAIYFRRLYDPPILFQYININIYAIRKLSVFIDNENKLIKNYCPTSQEQSHLIVQRKSFAVLSSQKSPIPR